MGQGGGDLRRAGALLVAVAAAAGGVAAGPGPLVAGGRVVELTVTAGRAGDPTEFTFSGYSDGALTVAVPPGTMVIVHVRNGGTIPHSLLVLPLASSQPPLPEGPPAFPGASTPHPDLGLAPGREATVSFEASRPGAYEFLCGVPGHALAGMWDRLVVSPDVSAPRVTPEGAARELGFTVR